jgi:hypothetical protein
MHEEYNYHFIHLVIDQLTNVVLVLPNPICALADRLTDGKSDEKRRSDKKRLSRKQN